MPNHRHHVSQADQVQHFLNEAERLREYAAEATTLDLRRRLRSRADEIEALAGEAAEEV
jgi:hypothetical protein